MFGIIIPTVGRLQSLGRCIDSILEQSMLPEEITIVDCSLRAEVAGFVDGVLAARAGSAGVIMRHLRSMVTNAPAQKNIGVRSTDSEIVCFLDDDVVLSPSYLQVMDSAFRSNPLLGGAGGVIESPKTDSGLKLFIKRLFLLNHDHGPGLIQKSGLPNTPVGLVKAGEPIETKVLMGCACYRRDVLAEVGGFDEVLGVTHLWEDVDLAHRVSKVRRLLYVPEARMIHFHSPGGRLSFQRYVACYVFNHYYLFSKHVQKSPLSLLAFVWSGIGSLIYLVSQGCIERHLISAIGGLSLGYLWVARNLITHWRPDYDAVARC